MGGFFYAGRTPDLELKNIILSFKTQILSTPFFYYSLFSKNSTN